MARRVYSLLVVIPIAIALLLQGCGGSKTSTSTAPTEAATAATSVGGAMATEATVPSDLKCKSQIVWVNLSKGVYHEKGDPWYGRTKHGEYECLAAANGHGYHLAGSRKH